MSTHEEETKPEQDSSSPSDGLTCSAWVSPLTTPLIEILNESWTLEDDLKTLRLFAIKLKAGACGYDIFLGSIADDLSLINQDGDDLGLNVGDVDFYAQVFEPNVKVLVIR